MSRGVAGLACCFKRVSLAVIVESGGGGPDQGGTREKWPDSRCTVRWGHRDFQVGNGGDRNPGCQRGWSLSTREDGATVNERGAVLEEKVFGEDQELSRIAF